MTGPRSVVIPKDECIIRIFYFDVFPLLVCERSSAEFEGLFKKIRQGTLYFQSVLDAFKNNRKILQRLLKDYNSKFVDFFYCETHEQLCRFRIT